MPLLRLDNVTVNLGVRLLLDGVELVVRAGERVGVLGRNGEGKSTLLKVVAGEQAPDGGERWLRAGVKVASLAQSLPEREDISIYDWVAGGLAEAGEALRQYHRLLTHAESDLKALERAQQQLEAHDGWNLDQRVDTVLTRLELPADAILAELSGGWRRRAALARALVQEPDILLLDEPTNHLDIPAIEWLQEQLQSFGGAVLLVTHDRAFLRAVANTIVELDRGSLYRWDGDYGGFLKFRAERQAAEERANELFDKKLSEEERWIRQGIKARRTRNEGRVRALKEMRRERAERRERQGVASFSVDTGSASGKIVAELEHVHHAFGDKVVIDDFSAKVLRGDRIGLIGANGAGKSTLLKILLGELQPDGGTVTLGTRLEIAYFDQLRATLDPDKNLIDNICGGRDFIEINGKQRHAISYLGDFLFAPERARTPVRALSGGEQNRAILAKLFSKPANMLVLDEPTNDLDMETLELLEEILLQFDGTVLLVSHDREFMDNVVTSVWVLEREGRVAEYLGGYSDWIARGGSLLSKKPTAPVKRTPPVGSQPIAAEVPAAKTQVPATKKKLSYKDQRELDGLPTRIEALEKELEALQTAMSAPEFYQQPQDEVTAVLQQVATLNESLEAAIERWAELEGMQ